MRSLAPMIALLPVWTTVVASDSWTLSGSYKNLLVRSRTAQPMGERYVQDLSRLRLGVRGRPFRDLAIDLQYDNEVLLGNYLSTRQFQLQRELPPPTYWKLQQTYADGVDAFARHRLHRASVTWSTGNVDLRLGRQRVAWGTGRFFSAVDALNPFDPTSIEPGERPGVDALLAEWRPGSLARLSAVLAPSWGPGTGGRVLRWHANEADADYSVLVGHLADRPTLGVDLATQVGGTGLRAEWVVVRIAHRSRTRLLFGIDHAFTDQFSLTAEVFHDEAAARDTDRYDFDALFAGRLPTLGRRHVGVRLRYEITPLLQSDADLIVNASDGSRFAALSFTWSLTTNLEGKLGARSFKGQPTSEYGVQHDAAFAQLQWYF